jgi:hypothetical protein
MIKVIITGFSFGLDIPGHPLTVGFTLRPLPTDCQRHASAAIAANRQTSKQGGAGVQFDVSAQRIPIAIGR